MTGCSQQFEFQRKKKDSNLRKKQAWPLKEYTLKPQRSF